MFDLMAWFSRDVILGKIEIPSKEERDIDQNLWIEKC
jgi:trimethylamine monooxygenase